MNEKTKVVLGTVKAKEGKYGMYFSGQLGMTWITISETKTPGTWKITLEQKEDRDQPMKPKVSIGRAVNDDDGIPF